MARPAWLPPTASEVVSGSVRPSYGLPLPAVHALRLACATVLVRAIARLSLPDAGKLNQAPASSEKVLKISCSNIKATASIQEIAKTVLVPRVVGHPPAKELVSVYSVGSVYNEGSEGDDDLVVFPSYVGPDSLPAMDMPTPANPCSDTDSPAFTTPAVDVSLPLQQRATLFPLVGTAT